MNKIFICLIFASTMFLSGCTTGSYSKFYVDKTNGHPLDPTIFRILQENEKPRMFTSANPSQDALSMLTDGYIMLGYSSFNGKYERTNRALQQAKKLKATHVLLHSEYTNTEIGSMPVFTYTPGKVVTSNNYGNFSANTYGSGGLTNTYGNYSGTSSTYIPGSSSVNYVPKSVRRYDQSASYWVHKERWGVGIHPEVPSDSIRKQIGSNKGVVLAVVVKNTPAYYADLITGDVVLKFNGEDVYGVESFSRMLDEDSDKSAVLTIYRDGELLEKNIKYNY